MSEVITLDEEREPRARMLGWGSQAEHFCKRWRSKLGLTEGKSQGQGGRPGIRRGSKGTRA